MGKNDTYPSFSIEINDLSENSVSQLKENRKLTIFPKNGISMWAYDTDFHAIT